jgi:hypothetical protein
MTTTTLSPTPVQKFFDNNGIPLASGKLFTYQAGTTTKLSTYTDQTGSTPNTNPVILNARGEAQIWVPPNVAYKFVLAAATDTDPPTSPIWTVDQITNSQLITLYGGVDTGGVNAYVLTFTANFTSYTDGIIIYWIPANTNTGASTINVNGLGVINIVNPDGSALSAREIIANQPVQILIKGGAAQLITPAPVLNSSFNCTWNGFSVPPVSTSVSYRRTGNITALTFGGVPSTGTSNAATFTMTGIPVIAQGGPLFQLVPCLGMIDNGATLTTAGVALISPGSIQFFKDASQPAWTAAGAKGFSQFITLVFAN